MIKIIIEDTEEELKNQGADRCGELNCSCGGGYAVGNEIHVDSGLPFERLRLVVVHEALCKELVGRIKHSGIDQVAIDIIDGLTQIGAFND